MNATGAVVLFLSIWFLTLFVLLPLGQRSQADMGEVTPGTPASAPHKPQLLRKMIWASIITAILWAIAAWMIVGGVISRDDVMGWDSFLRN